MVIGYKVNSSVIIHPITIESTKPSNMTDQPEQAQPSAPFIASDNAITTNQALAAAMDPEAAAALLAAKDNPDTIAGGAAAA